jgi:hypothetical protein
MVNYTFEKIVNFREILQSSSHNFSGKLFRSGSVTKGTLVDVTRLKEQIGIKTFIDLRSPLEIREDRQNMTSHFQEFSFISAKNIINPSNLLHNNSNEKVTYSIPLVTEKQAAYSIFHRLSLKNKFIVGLLLLPSLFSKKIRKYIRRLFTDTVNVGGLKLLYEIILEHSGSKIVLINNILKDPNRLPAVIFCTAGKDRTGIVSMFIQYRNGMMIDEIVEDYSRSEFVYDEINDPSATVATLQQVDLDVQAFTSAPPHVMKETIQYIIDKYGSIDGYLRKHENI